MRQNNAYVHPVVSLAQRPNTYIVEVSITLKLGLIDPSFGVYKYIDSLTNIILRFCVFFELMKYKITYLLDLFTLKSAEKNIESARKNTKKTWLWKESVL